ncbi:hypothetical protein CASFOL_032702 [Castilleja foliolosa]|uniref:Syntaxin 6/10/61 N-terminal domain-containing protein n=1 Tax=Castilleja foliolosa TaxID=1961234 RepID=A0ABD3C296_9LAMI
MMAVNSFDLWQKDTFFSAAEEVQQSADTMESAYRRWLRARRDIVPPQHLDELSRELQMALGTTKWQLEEFEKAVRQSYINNCDDMTITRHKQFVSAIESQINCIEKALSESLNMEGKKPFRWVNLDEEECDDLALFLSGTPQRIKNEGRNIGPVVINSFNKSDTNEDCTLVSEVSSKVHTPPNHSSENVDCEMQGSKSPVTPLEIVIDAGERRENALVEVTPKEKGFKPFFWRLRGKNYPGAKTRMISSIDQHLRGGHRNQRQQPMSSVLPVNSIRFILALTLTVFLVVCLF